MPLSEDEAARIREEEALRQEARADFEKKKELARTRREKFWHVINSPLAMWVLSTVVVGVVTLLYTKHQSSVRLAEERAATARKLEAEVGSRRNETLKALSDLKGKLGRNAEDCYEPRWIYAKAVALLNGGDEELKTVRPVYHPEFKEKRFTDLLDALEQSSPNNPAAAKWRSKFAELEALYSRTSDAPCALPPSEADKKSSLDGVSKAEEIIDSM